MKFSSVLCLILFGLTGACDRKAPKQPLAPPPIDAFSGETVVDGVHAQNLVMSRLGNAPTKGNKAPDGQLIDAESGEIVRLSELWREKPVVLIFGSGTCTSSNLFSEDFEVLSERFKGDAKFFFLYIREAHPDGGYHPPLEGDFAELQIPPIVDSVTVEARCSAALAFQKRGEFNLPTLVDSLNDSVAIQWSAWPARIFVVGSDGTVLYAGDQGPWYFNVTRDGWHDPPPNYVEEVLRGRSYDRISLEEFLETQYGSK